MTRRARIRHFAIDTLLKAERPVHEQLLCDETLRSSIAPNARGRQRALVIFQEEMDKLVQDQVVERQFDDVRNNWGNINQFILYVIPPLQKLAALR